jgi:hypothetical protein
MYPSDDTEARLRLLIRQSVALRHRLQIEVERSRLLCAGRPRSKPGAEARETMALRYVTVDGDRWTVWEVWPQGFAGRRVREELQEGWLAMHFASQKRRVTPIPAGWLEWTDEEMAEAVRAARPAPGSRSG